MAEEAFSNINTAKAVVELGIKKANTPIQRVFVLGILGGLFVALGFYATLAIMASVSGSDFVYLSTLFGAITFPVGLMLILLVGGDLFTGNSLITLSILDKKSTLIQLIKNWLAVWFGNLTGTSFSAFLIVKSGEVSLKTQNVASMFAHKKLALSSPEIFISAFFCNILVSLAIWSSLSTKDVTAKIFIVFFCIFLFFITGFQHCVANMFLFSFNILLNTGESINTMAKHLAMTTLGNAFSGGFVIPIVYYYLYIKK